MLNSPQALFNKVD